jgi:type I restriction enzyme S subunit
MSEWKEYKLGDVASVQTGPFGSQLHQKDYVVVGTPIITVEHLGDNRITYQNLPKVSDEDKQRLKKYHLQEGDVVFSRVGSVDRRALVTKKEDGWLFSGRCLRVRGIENKADGAFLSYYFGQESFKEYVRRIAVGATMPSINTTILSEIVIKLPPLPTQTAIAEILSSLDDKIELNNKINQELEALAQTLFKRWFIDFEFPNENGEPYKSSGGEMVESELGEIPKGWEVKDIESLTNKMSSGGTPSTRRTDYYDGNIKWYSTKELKDGFLFESERMISVSGLENSSAKLFPPNTVVMAIYAAPTVGRLGVLTEEASFNQAALGFVAKDDVGYEFIFLLLKHLRSDLNNLANGAAQQNLNVGIVKNYRVIYPPHDLLKSFNSIISPMFNCLKNNQEGNIDLAKTRDTLLPKLISGELEINEISNQ